jgi:hypothetical protein
MEKWNPDSYRGKEWKYGMMEEWKD